MSKSPIVARRRVCQLATTAPVLTPPGKPSTWFPGEELVTQAQFCNLLLHMFLEITFCHEKFYICYLMLFLFCLNLTQNLLLNMSFAFKYVVLTSFDVIRTLHVSFHIIFEISKN